MGDRRASTPDPASAALLARLGTKSAPLSHEAVLASREQAPDPQLAGTPEPVALRAELTLPLEQSPLRARLYRDNLREPQPVVVWLHGGGFCGGTLDDVDTTCAAIARRAPAIVLSLDYRLAPEHPFPAALNDTVDTLAWLHRHGRELGGNGRLAVGGQSAGGNLAAAASLVAREHREPRIEAQILCYPALDFSLDGESHRTFDGLLSRRSESKWFYEQYLAGQTPTALASPLLADSLVGLPPALVITAECDPYRDDGRAYAARLQADGVATRHREYPGAIHAFLNFPGALPYAWQAIDEIAAFVSAQLELVSPPAALQHVTTLYDRQRADELRALYGAVLGLVEKPVPAAFAEAGIVWFAAGDGERELHFVPRDDAEVAIPHLCLQVDDLEDVAARLQDRGVDIEFSQAIVGRPRIFFRDWFGNTVEVASITGAYA